MSFNLPDSWNVEFDGKPRYLNEICDSELLSFLGADQLFFVEEGTLNPDTSHRKVRISNNVDSACVMTFVTLNAYLEKQYTTDNRPEVFIKSLIGGWSNLNDKKNIPLQCPMFPGMYCKDIVDITPFSPNFPDDDYTPLLNYDLVRMTLNFETLPYYVDKTQRGSFNPNWIIIGERGNSNRVSSPLGWYKFSTGSYIGFPAQVGLWQTQPVKQISFTILHVPDSKLRGADNTNFDSLKTRADSYIGTTNANEFGKFATDRLLLDSIDVQPWTNFMNERMYNFRLNFLENEWGFNKSLDPGASLESVVFSGTTIKPFQRTNMTTLVSLFNP